MRKEWGGQPQRTFLNEQKKYQGLSFRGGRRREEGEGKVSLSSEKEKRSYLRTTFYTPSGRRRERQKILGGVKDWGQKIQSTRGERIRGRRSEERNFPGKGRGVGVNLFGWETEIQKGVFGRYRRGARKRGNKPSSGVEKFGSHGGL